MVKSKMITFNSKKDRFEFVEAYTSKYSMERQIFLFDCKEDGLIKSKDIQLNFYKVTNCVGFEWLIENENLIKDIENGKQVDEKYLKIARLLNSSIDVYAWHEIENDNDIEELMDICGCFHDSYIRDFQGFFGRPYEPEFQTRIQLAFELYGNHFDITLEFYEGVSIHYNFCSNLNGIYLSTIMFHDGCIYWVDGGDDLRPIDIKDNPYIMSKKLRWKITDKK